MIKLEISFETKAELVAFLGGDVQVTSDAAAPRPVVVAPAAKPEGIAAQPVKKGPGRPPKEKAAAPAAPVAVPEPAAPEQVETAEALETTFEDYKTAMTGFYTGGHRGIVLEVLAEYGAVKISGVPADKYDEVLAQVSTRVEALS